MKPPVVDVVILGAGPYGLSIASYLSGLNIPFRIFGSPLQSWKHNMPKGMFLKSDGFASNLYDPDDAFTLAHYCRETGRAYADIGLPVPLETFTAYGLEFQKRMVPTLEDVKVSSIKAGSDSFELKTETGESLRAGKVIIAAGISHFGYLPPVLADLPGDFASHSSRHHDLTGFKGRKVAVVGGGSSAVDLAALLHEAGAEVELVARTNAIVFHEPAMEPRSLLQQVLSPRSGLGLGWRSRLCTDAPLLFHAMPEKFRLEVLRRHLGPSVGWFVKSKIFGHVPMHLGATLSDAQVRGDRVHLKFEVGGSGRELIVDHVIGGTGYRVALERLKFLDPDLVGRIRAVEGAPVLSRAFESSVPGLYFIGVASASCFGPLARFAYGAGFTARHLSKHLASARA